MKKILIVIAAGIIFSLNTVWTLAATTQLKVNIEGGTLSLVNPQVATLSAISLEQKTETSAGDLGEIEVVDNRGTGSGWSVTATISDFACCSNKYKITADNLTVTPGSMEVVSGEADGVSAGAVKKLLSSNDIVNIMTAQSGSGMGNYRIKPSLSLLIPNNVYTGEYSATLVLTVI